MILYCKNASVYDIDTEEVLCKALLPGLMSKYADSQTFEAWCETRYSSLSNNLARKLNGLAVGMGKRKKLNRLTNMFSLSDCYWIKDKKSSVKFEDVSPYYNNFWTGEGEYTGGSIPTSYVGGYLSKEWKNSKELWKYGDCKIEEDCSTICEKCGISSVKNVWCDDHLVSYNFTSVNVMLEQGDQSGRLNVHDYDEYTMVELFGMYGFQMVLVDAIVGNGDRHPGNFGWLRDTNTGEYLRPAPLYDFDHALDSKSGYDILISDVIDLILKRREYLDEAMTILDIAPRVKGINPLFAIRAVKLKDTLLERLEN